MLPMYDIRKHCKCLAKLSLKLNYSVAAWKKVYEIIVLKE